MSENIQFPFTTPGNYTFNSNICQIAAGLAKLKLNDLPEQSFVENFDNDIGFTYDSDLAEFSGGQVQQKDIRPSNAIFYSPYTSDINGAWGNGTLTGNAVNGAAVVSERLDLAHDDVRYVDYDADGNADSQQTGCVRFKITPNYSGAPSANKAFIAIGKQSGSLWNLIQIHQDSIGNIRIALYNSTGGAIFDGILDSWLPTAGVTYEFEFNWDITTGASRLFIDGTQLGSTITGTGTRDSDINLFRVGSTYDAVDKSNFYMEDVLIFSTVQHTTNYTPDWSNVYETIYVASTVILPEMEYIGAGTLILFQQFSTSEGGSPRYTLQIGRSGNYLFWNGSAWVISDGTYTQANDATIFNTNCGDLDVDGEVYGQFKIHFDNSDSQSSVSTLTAILTGQQYPQSNPLIECNETFISDELEDFTETASYTGNDDITYILSKDSTYYYWNGTAWVESDETYSQSNDASEILANIDSFLSSPATIKIGIFLHSEDGFSTPELDLLSIDYSYGGETPDTINKCIVWGYNFDPEGNPNTDPFYIFLSSDVIEYKNNIIIRKEKITVTPDSAGYWEVELIENENMQSGAYYIFLMNYLDSYDVTQRNLSKKVVPNEATKNFNDLEDYGS